MSSFLQVKPYWRTDDESVWSLSFKERQPLFLLQSKHDDRQREHQSLSGSSEGNSNHVSTWQTTHTQTNKHKLSAHERVYMCVRVDHSFHSGYSTYTVGIPWIWMGVGCTIPFFFKPFRIAAKKINNWVLFKPRGNFINWVWFLRVRIVRNLVGTSSLWNFWLEQGCHLHQPGCGIFSWHVRVWFQAYSGCNAVPSNCKEYSELSRRKLFLFSKSVVRSSPCFYRIIVYDTFSHFLDRHQSFWMKRTNQFSMFTFIQVNLIQMKQNSISTPRPSATLSRIFSSSFSCFSLADSLRAVEA